MNIYWYCPPSVNSDFKNPLDNPSFRLRCYNIHTQLVKDGYNSKIVSETHQIIDPDVVVLMSFGITEYNLALWVTSQGGQVFHDYAENFRGDPVLENTKSLCKYLVCSSTWLRNEEAKTYPDKAVVIKDMIEEVPVIHNFSYKREKLKVVWSGMSGNAPFVSEFLKPIVEKNGMEYVEISNRPEATILWDENWYFHMASCDIAICPQMHWYFPAKSNVKVTTAMGLGLPVIGSPIQSYYEIIENGINGYIAESLEDWSTYLNKLKNYNLRYNFVSKANLKLRQYRSEYIYQQWLDLFKSCKRNK